MSETDSMPADLRETLHAVSARIHVPDRAFEREARAHLDSLTKPLGSLGNLEDLAAQMSRIRRGNLAVPQRPAVYVFAADHGIAAEGVSAYPAEVTRQMVLNFLSGGAAINVLARCAGASVHVVDVGVAGDLADHPCLLDRKIRRGSRNMRHEPAMRWDELAQAIHVGMEAAEDAAGCAYTVVAVGEMGIGNTTSASVLTAALTGRSAADVTGRGTGLAAEAHAKKISIVAAILAKHRSGAGKALAAGVEGMSDAADLLRRFGGLEIAAMAGLILGLAANGIAVICDGFISTAAAAFAVALAPTTRPFLFAGHLSEEPGHAILLQHLGVRPILQLNMRLGEGTGAVLAMPILEAAQRLYTEMATFASAGISGASA